MNSTPVFSFRTFFQSLRYLISIPFRSQKRNVLQNKIKHKAFDPIDEAYTAFESMTRDKWWVPISSLTRQEQEAVANAWIHILVFAKRTKTLTVLRQKMDEADNMCGEMGPFSRAELCYEIIYPNGHQEARETFPSNSV